MAGQVINIFVIIAAGVIIADLVMPGHVEGTNALFKGLSDLWGTGVKGMLGQPS